MGRTIDEVEVSRGDGVPVIDMAGIDGAERQRIAAEIVEACETWGIFQVINHGIDVSLLQRAKEVSREFFALPSDEKLQLRLIPGSVEGYSPSKLRGTDESQNLIIAPEYLHNAFETDLPEHKKRWPRNPPAYSAVMSEYTKQARALQELMLGVLSEALGLERSAMQKCLEGPNGRLRHTIRINHYAPNNGADTAGHGLALAHTDPAGITMLLADDVPGLEAKKDGRWVLVDPIANAFIFNVSDQVEVMSNGRFKSAVHRGMPHKTLDRFSLVYFYGPEFETSIGPLDEVISESHPPRYKTQTYSDFFAAFLQKAMAQVQTASTPGDSVPAAA